MKVTVTYNGDNMLSLEGEQKFVSTQVCRRVKSMLDNFPTGYEANFGLVITNEQEADTAGNT